MWVPPAIKVRALMMFQALVVASVGLKYVASIIDGKWLVVYEKTKDFRWCKTCKLFSSKFKLSFLGRKKWTKNMGE